MGAYVPDDIHAFVQAKAKAEFAGNVSALLVALLRALQRGDIEVNVSIRQTATASGLDAREIYDASSPVSAGA